MEPGDTADPNFRTLSACPNFSAFVSFPAYRLPFLRLCFCSWKARKGLRDIACGFKPSVRLSNRGREDASFSREAAHAWTPGLQSNRGDNFTRRGKPTRVNRPFCRLGPCTDPRAPRLPAQRPRHSPLPAGSRQRCRAAARPSLPSHPLYRCPQRASRTHVEICPAIFR